MLKSDANTSVSKEHSRFLCSMSNTANVSEKLHVILICQKHDFIRLQRQLNNALQQAGIYTINMTIFGVEEAVDTTRYEEYFP